MDLMGGRVSGYATAGMWRPEGANLFVPTWRTCSQKLHKPILMGFVASPFGWTLEKWRVRAYERSSPEKLPLP
jgi:hypothetical protein